MQLNERSRDGKDEELLSSPKIRRIVVEQEERREGRRSSRQNCAGVQLSKFDVLWAALVGIAALDGCLLSCSQFQSNRKQSLMSKRAQESISRASSGVTKTRLMNLVSSNLLSAKKILRKIRVIHTSRRIKNWIRVVFHPVAGN